LIAARGVRDEATQAVENEEHRICEFRTRSPRPGPQLDEQVLEAVGEAADSHHAHHSGRSLHGVRFAKDPIDRGLIIRRRLKRENPRSDALEVAFGLLDEQRPKLVL